MVVHDQLIEQFPSQTQPDPAAASTHVHPLETSVERPSLLTYREYINSRVGDEMAATAETLEPFYGLRGYDKFERFLECKSRAYFARSKTTGEIRVMGSACRDRWCPHCSRARAAEVREQVTEWLHTVKNPRMITFTLKHSNAVLKDQVTGLYKCFRKWRLLPEVKAAVVAGVWFLQIKRSSRSGNWHPHLHCLMVGKFLPWKFYRQTWLKVTGTSHVVNVEYIRNLDKAADYVARYVSRPAMLKEYILADRLEIVDTCHGRRLFGTWGRKGTKPMIKRVKRDFSDWQRIADWNYIYRTRDTDDRSHRIWRAWLTGQPVSEEDISILLPARPSGRSAPHVDQPDLFMADGPPGTGPDIFHM
jgi:hypothetical protein